MLDLFGYIDPASEFGIILEMVTAEHCRELAQQRIEAWMADHPSQDVPDELLQWWHESDCEYREAEAALAALDAEQGS